MSATASAAAIEFAGAASPLRVGVSTTCYESGAWIMGLLAMVPGLLMLWL